MKRVLTFLAIMLLPLSLMAMTPISDKDMSKVTGQAGVSMTFDLTLNMQFGQLGWGDADGAAVNIAGFSAAGTGVAGGWVGIDSLKISTLHIWPRTDYTMESTGFIGGTYKDEQFDGGWESLHFLTIDVVTIQGGLGSTLADSLFSNTALTDHITAVRIGVPTLTLTMAQMTGNVVLGTRSDGGSVGGIVNGIFYAAKDTQAPNFDQLLGKFYLGGLNMATGGGEIYIFAHGHATTANAEGLPLYGSGVTIALNNVRIDYLLLEKAAWGDIDGAYDVSSIDSTFTTGYGTLGTMTDTLANPGWVGIKDLAIQNIVISGIVAIDVGSYNTMAYTHAGADFALSTGSTGDISDLNFVSLVPTFDDAFSYMGQNGVGGDQIGQTFIFIALQNIEVKMNKMYGSVQLWTDVAGVPNPDVTPSAQQVLGDIYVGGMTMNITANPVTGTNSWFAIFAH